MTELGAEASVRRVGIPSLVIGAAHATLLVVAWVLLARDEVLAGLLFAVWIGAGVAAGLADGLLVLYAGRTATVRRRLVLGGLRFEGGVARWGVLGGSIVVGDVVGWALSGAGDLPPGVGLEGIVALIIAVLLGLLGVTGAFAVLLLVVVPVGFLLASTLPRVEADHAPGSEFTAMSVGELRGGSLALLSLAWLLPAFLLTTARVGGEAGARVWLASCGIALVLVVVGVIVNNRGVRERRRARDDA